MNPVIILVGTLFFLVYGLLNYYIGLRGWQTLFSCIPLLSAKVYWAIFLFIAFSFIISRLSEGFLPKVLYEGLTKVGAYWMAFMLYFLLITVSLDILKYTNRWLNLIPIEGKHGFGPIAGLIACTVVAGIVIYGVWNASHPKIHHYDLSIAKSAGSVHQLHVVMVSDIHLGAIIHKDHLIKLVDQINKLRPNLILFAGDVFDEDIEFVKSQQVADTFLKLEAPYGVYAVLGNHEYIGGNAEEAIRYLNQAGIKVLKDSYQLIADSFYLIGRDDMSGSRFNGAKRQDLKTLMQGINYSLPIILMDHQPSHLEEPVAQGVDLQVSGHTHSGQMFPFQFITQKLFEQDWGLLRKGDFQLIVSSGYGTWGPPVRIGNTPEIVDINITFKP